MRGEDDGVCIFYYSSVSLISSWGAFLSRIYHCMRGCNLTPFFLVERVSIRRSGTTKVD